MADRHRALRAVARQLAAERADAPSPRPRSARIPLPAAHLADVAAGRTHRLRLTAPAVDPERLRGALEFAAARHDALRLGVVRDSGRSFLATADHPVARVPDPAGLAQADPEHPVRWALVPEAGQVTVTLAVSAYLMDRSCWGTVLATVEAAYLATTTAGPPPPELGYGDYCYWLAHRPGPDPAAGQEVVREIGYPVAEPYWTFARSQPWAVRSDPVPDRPSLMDDLATVDRASTVERLAADLAGALRACGWQGTGVRMRRWRSRPPQTPIVGRVDEPVVGTVAPGGGRTRSAPAAVVAGALDEWWESFPEPLVQVDVDVIDLPRLRFDGQPVRVEPLLEPAPGWQCLLLRQPDGPRLQLAGGEPTLPALHAALAGHPDNGAPAGHASPRTPATVAAAEPAGDPPCPQLVTPQRTLPPRVVAGAVARRAEELRAAGARPGGQLVIESTEGPETVANLLAGLRCRADVLLLDPDDPPAWRTGLVARLSGAVHVTADNQVRPADPAPTPGDRPPGDGEGALLLGLSSTPGTPVLARVPLADLARGASALAELWQLAAGRSVVVNPARTGEDLVLKVLACARAGADLVLAGGDGTEAVELLAQLPDSYVEVQLVEDWAAPLHQLTSVRWLRRAVDHAPDAVTTWWVAEAPAGQWLATEAGLQLRSGSARLVDAAGRSMPDGTVGELATGVSIGCRYLDDPRRTADRLRPAPGGGRELRTATLAGWRAPGLQVLRFAPDRVVDRNRTCLTDAWHALVTGGFVGVQPVGGHTAEGAFVVSPRPLPPVALPRPLAAALTCVEPAAAGLDFDTAWRCVAVRAGGAADDPDEADQAWATPEEVTLAKEIVERILDTPVRRNDNLFSLGATSLQLMRVLLQVKERVGVEVPLARFFATPTVAVLAELIREPADPPAAALDLLDEIALDEIAGES